MEVSGLPPANLALAPDAGLSSHNVYVQVKYCAEDREQDAARRANKVLHPAGAGERGGVWWRMVMLKTTSSIRHPLPVTLISVYTFF